MAMLLPDEAEFASVNMNKVIRMCLIHDLGESFTGDIPTFQKTDGDAGVQGVGFRYRAIHAADLYGCTGWVSNNYDGSVIMEIQGEESAIDNVILAIEARRYIRIENMDIKTLPVDEGERGFRVR